MIERRFTCFKGICFKSISIFLIIILQLVRAFSFGVISWRRSRTAIFGSGLKVGVAHKSVASGKFFKGRRENFTRMFAFMRCCYVSVSVVMEKWFFWESRKRGNNNEVDICVFPCTLYPSVTQRPEEQAGRVEHQSLVFASSFFLTNI